MRFKRQADALALVEQLEDHLIIAEDISRHGHKSYIVTPKEDVNKFTGPHNELIQTSSACRLYFDLDGGQKLLKGAGDLIEKLIAFISRFVYQIFNLHVNLKDVIVLCSSSEVKFSYHLIFKTVIFRDNFNHMRNFVFAFLQHLDTIDTALTAIFDNAVYSRNRCFRMAGCCKFGDAQRIFKPGVPADALVQVDCDTPLEFGETVVIERKNGVSRKQASIGTFDLNQLNVPSGWRKPLQGLEIDELLNAIHPKQEYAAFFSIGCAFKRAGGSVEVFCEWCKEYRRPVGCARQWAGWNKRGKGYGYTFLKQLALHSASQDETAVLLDEAFGFHPPDNVLHFDSTYIDFNLLRTVKEKCILVKSRTGSGKSTVARKYAFDFTNKRILYLVSSRPLSYGAKHKLNTIEAFRRDLDFVNYLDTNQPLHKFDHLVCSIQSLWRAARLEKKPYDLIIVDEISSVIEDMTNVTNKHPRANQEALRWFATRCTKFIGLDAHLMDTSLDLTEDYFGNDVKVVINHNHGPKRNAVFIPLPQWSGLNNLRTAACSPNATIKEVNKFSDATCLYDLLFDCWSKNVKTFFVCNNVRLGNWIEDNYLRRSYTKIALLSTGLCDNVCDVITDFACKTEKTGFDLLKYAWIKKGDGRKGADFKSLDWWSELDHLQYTLKICQGMDFNPKTPHFGVGFCYSTPNTAVPRRVLQQVGRTRRYAQNPVVDVPTIYFAIGERVMVKHLPVCGMRNIEKFANEQEYFMQTVVKHHSVTIKNYFDWMFAPEPVWRKLYMRVMNEREVFLRYPRESFKWWLRHDNWTTSRIQLRPKPVVQWAHQAFESRNEVAFESIKRISDDVYTYLSRRRNLSPAETQQIKRYRFSKTFILQTEGLWDLYTEHPGWVCNAVLERFGELENVIKRRFNLLLLTQKPSEWVDTTAGKLVFIRKLTKTLGLTELWASDNRTISPNCFWNATEFVEVNKKAIKLAFGLKNISLKSILHSWGGYRLTILKRIRKKHGTVPRAHNPPTRHVEPVESTVNTTVEVQSPVLQRPDVRPLLLKVHNAEKDSNAPTRNDFSIRQIKSFPWHLLRNPEVST